MAKRDFCGEARPTVTILLAKKPGAGTVARCFGRTARTGWREASEGAGGMSITVEADSLALGGITDVPKAEPTTR